MRSQRHLIEQLIRLGKPEAVDRAAGIIRGCKILGLESLNGRRYTQAAVAAAVKLYEGRAVNADHPARPSDSRSVHDRFGWFEAVTVRADGLWGDFHVLNPKSELAESLFAAAEKRPDMFGFSHNCLAEGESDSAGVFVVGAITEVRSVDLVADPATTNGLFEGRGQPMKIKLKAALEAALPKAPKAERAKLKAIVEDAGMDDPLGMEVDAPDDGGSWRDQAGDLVGMLVASDDAEAHDLAKKIMAVLKPEAAAAPTEGDDEKPKTEAEGDGEKDKEKTESIRRELKQLKDKDAVRDLCESLDFRPSKTQLKALLALDNDADRKALITESKGAAPKGSGPRSASRHAMESRSSGQGSGGDGKDYSAVKDGKSLAGLLKGR